MNDKKEKFWPAITHRPALGYRFPDKSPEQIAEEMMRRNDLWQIAQHYVDEHDAQIAQKTCQ